MSFMYSTGMMIFTIVVILSNLKMLVFSKTHHNFTLFFIFGSIAFYIITFYIFNIIYYLESYRTFSIMHYSPYYYLVTWEIIGFTFVTDLMIWRFLGINLFIKYFKEFVFLYNNTYFFFFWFAYLF